MKDFFSIILGNATLPQFAAALFFAYLTAFAMLLIRSTKRDISSSRTPFKFSWSFLYSDNFKRIWYTVILIFLCVRFGQKWIGPEYVTYLGLAIGILSDSLAWIFELIHTQLESFAKSKVSSINQPKV